MIKVLCSGGFDPLHVGHLRYLVAAAEYGSVIVALNSDAWLMDKKGLVFMMWCDRAKIIGALSCVEAVYPVNDDDGTICSALQWLMPYYCANGGDRTEPNPEEDIVCKSLGIKQLFNITKENLLQ